MTDVTYLALRFQSHFWTTSIIYYGIMDHLPEDYQYPLAYTTLASVGRNGRSRIPPACRRRTRRQVEVPRITDHMHENPSSGSTAWVISQKHAWVDNEVSHPSNAIKLLRDSWYRLPASSCGGQRGAVHRQCI